MTLYELKAEYQLLLALAEDPGTDPDVFRDTLDALEGEIEDKADGYAVVMTQLQGDADMLKKEIDRLKAREEAIDSNVKRMKDALQAAMIATDKRKFKTALHSFSIAKNPASIVKETEDYSKIPAEYWKMRDPDIDWTAIKKDLQAGKELPGVGHLVQGESLRIR